MQYERDCVRLSITGVWHRGAGQQQHLTTAQQNHKPALFVALSHIHTWFCKSNWSTRASGRLASAQSNADMGTLILNQPPGAVCAGAVALVRGSLPQYKFDSVFLSSIFSTGSCGAGRSRGKVVGATMGRGGLTQPTKLAAAGVRPSIALEYITRVDH